MSRTATGNLAITATVKDQASGPLGDVAAKFAEMAGQIAESDAKIATSSKRLGTTEEATGQAMIKPRIAVSLAIDEQLARFRPLEAVQARLNERYEQSRAKMLEFAKAGLPIPEGLARQAAHAQRTNEHVKAFAEGLQKARDRLDLFGKAMIAGFAGGAIALAFSSLRTSLETLAPGSKAERSFHALGLAVTRAKDSIGDLLIPVLRAASDTMGPLLKTFSTWVDRNRELVTSRFVDWLKDLASLFVNGVATGALLATKAIGGLVQLWHETKSFGHELVSLNDQVAGGMVRTAELMARDLGFKKLEQEAHGVWASLNKKADESENKADRSAAAAARAMAESERMQKQILGAQLALGDVIDTIAAKSKKAAKEGIGHVVDKTAYELEHAKLLERVNQSALEAAHRAIFLGKEQGQAVVEAWEAINKASQGAYLTQMERHQALRAAFKEAMAFGLQLEREDEERGRQRDERVAQRKREQNERERADALNLSLAREAILEREAGLTKTIVGRGLAQIIDQGRNARTVFAGLFETLGVSKLEDAQRKLEKIEAKAHSYAASISAGVLGLIDAAADKTRHLGEALGSFFAGLARQIGEMLLQKGITKLLDYAIEHSKVLMKVFMTLADVGTTVGSSAVAVAAKGVEVSATKTAVVSEIAAYRALAMAAAFAANAGIPLIGIEKGAADAAILGGIISGLEGAAMAPMAAGGLVRGGISGRDSVPALLMPGELVVPTPLVRWMASALGRPAAAAQPYVDPRAKGQGGDMHLHVHNDSFVPESAAHFDRRVRDQVVPALNRFRRLGHNA